MANDSPNQEGLREVPAREIMENIKSCKLVDYDHAIITGDLLASNWDLSIEDDKYVVESEIKIINSQFKGVLRFERVIFRNPVVIQNSQFGDFAFFSEAVFNGAAKFSESRFPGYTYFYREMEAKRKQKPWYFRYPEYVFIQLIFGYGVHPERLAFWWGITVIAFAVLYEMENAVNGATQLLDYLKISFATAIAPGYIASIINPGSTGYRLLPEYQGWAMIETLIGTFMWAGFIATFARKYMK